MERKDQILRVYFQIIFRNCKKRRVDLFFFSKFEFFVDIFQIIKRRKNKRKKNFP